MFTDHKQGMLPSRISVIAGKPVLLSLVPAASLCYDFPTNLPIPACQPSCPSRHYPQVLLPIALEILCSVAPPPVPSMRQL